MSTTITASYTVFPDDSTPSTRLWLSDSDQVARWSHTSTIYVYKESPSHDAIARMRDSLGKILVHYYPIAGRLSWIEGARLELNCNSKGVTLLEAESTKTMAEYEDFAPSETIKKELTPAVDYTQPIEELPLLLVQLTRFKGTNEGLVIRVVMSHVLADGLSAIDFITSWAKLCRGETLDPKTLPFLDRTLLKSFTKPRFDHPELKPLPLLLGSTDTVQEQNQKKTAVLLKLTKEHVEKLRKKANDQFQGSRPYSRYEVIAAHIWRSACKARELDDLQPTVVRVSGDIRNRINPPLPRYYFGNALAVALTPTCCANCSTPNGVVVKLQLSSKVVWGSTPAEDTKICLSKKKTCCAKDVILHPLSYGAQKIREAIELLSNEYIRSQFDFIRCQERLDWIRASYLDRGEPRNAPFYGNPNLSIVSWMGMPVFDVDFGWGNPVYFGPAAVYPDGKAYIIRSSEGDGSLVVSIHLQIRHMESFKKFFYEDI